MFPSRTGLLKNIPCPQKDKCTLGNCLFSHRPLRASEAGKPRETSRSVVAKRPSETSSQPESKRPKVLVPKLLPAGSPAAHSQRVRFVQVLRDYLEKSKTCYDPDAKAIELEAAAAGRSTVHTYPMAIRSLVHQIKSGALKDDVHKRDESNLDVYRDELAALIIPWENLIKRYIVAEPEPESLESSQKLNCDRCGAGITAGDLAGQCRFHPLRRRWEPNNSAKGGSVSRTFPCCGDSAEESRGCVELGTHVFKLASPEMLAGSTVPFRQIPRDAPGKHFAVGFDCEMAYTTRGMEMIRVTAVDYDTGKLLMDRLVRPFGEILDLNTRFSGVSDIDAGITLDGTHYPTIGFEEALELFFTFVGPSTILIGHGLENDMNVMRLVHDRIVDTAMLYPRVRTRTYPLKQLAWTYLGRVIQTGEHDSMEDALAAIDIIKADIKQRSTKLSK